MIFLGLRIFQTLSFFLGLRIFFGQEKICDFSGT